ncbi:putative very-long-chain 3-oxoacyl-CoA reductase [Helianthus anomalus]
MFVFVVSNNAGVLSPQFKLSKDEIELHFATNHLGVFWMLSVFNNRVFFLKIHKNEQIWFLLSGHFLLTNLLLETMKKTSYEQKTEGRIINVSSRGHRYAYNRPFSDQINDESSYNSLYAYGQSKLANILHAKELARRLKDEEVNITANSLHPGFIVTEIFRSYNVFSVICNAVLKYFVKDVSQGAATTCYLALNPKVKGVTSEYFSDSNLAKPTPRGEDQELAKELWEFSSGLTSSK